MEQEGAPPAASLRERSRAGGRSTVARQRLQLAQSPQGGTASAPAAATQHAWRRVGLRQAESRLQLAREAHADMLIAVADLQVLLALEQRQAAEAATELARAEAAAEEAGRRTRMRRRVSGSSSSPWRPSSPALAPEDSEVSGRALAARCGANFPVMLPASLRGSFSAWVNAQVIPPDEIIVYGDIGDDSVFEPIAPRQAGSAGAERQRQGQ